MPQCRLGCDADGSNRSGGRWLLGYAREPNLQGLEGEGVWLRHANLTYEN